MTESDDQLTDAHSLEARGVWLDDSIVELTLPAERVAARLARKYVADNWPQLPDDTLDDVSLIVSELVSNAVLHGEPDIGLRIRVKPFAVDVAVLDHGPDMPRKTDADHHADHGRGLKLVETLSQRWGVSPLGDGSGKYVWASVSHS